MKKSMFGISFAVAAFAFGLASGETRTVSNVDELYAALAELSNTPSMNYISLNAGTYDVSGRTHPGLGSAHLGATNVVFMGATGNREDVLVFGDMTRPVFGLYSGGVRHLTVSNGTRGVYAGGSGTIRTNIFVTCCSNTTENGGAGYQGTWNACLIAGNTAKLGGGLYICTAQNCIISNNHATSNGGGTYRGTMIGCTIVDNRAANGGGQFIGRLILIYIPVRSAGGVQQTIQLSDRLRATSFQKARWSFRSQELRKERICYDIPPVIDLNDTVLQQLHLC